MGAIMVRFAVRMAVGIAKVVAMVVAAPIICFMSLTKTRIRK